jgi:Flp pilus assembly protein TadG
MSRNLTAFLRRCARELSRFRRAREGATAVEYAFIFPIFLATLIGVLQTTAFLFAQAALQTAAVETGRQFMTGQNPTQASLTDTSQPNSICPIIQPLLTCASVMIDVQTYNSFGAANTSQPALPYTPQYNPGTPGQVVVVRLIYKWTVVGANLFPFANLPNSMREMMGVTAVRVEPYNPSTT